MTRRAARTGFQSERGAAMLAALCLAMVFAICLASYLALCYTSLKTSTRSLMSSRCLEISEMGLEQALYSANANNGAGDWTGWTLGGGQASTTLTATSAGLVPASGAPTPLNLGNSSTAQVSITVSPYPINMGAPPTIVSTATVTLGSDHTSVARTLTTTGGTAPLFVNAVAAIGGRVKFMAAGTLDSYDSRQPGSYATQNPALTPGLLGSSAIVLSQDTSTLSSTVHLNSAAVYGYAVGNQLNSISYTSSAYVGGYPPGPSGVDPTRLLTNPPPVPAPYPSPYPYALPYQPLFAEDLPASSNGDLGIITGSTSLPVSTATPAPYVYYSEGITLSGNSTITVAAPVILIVNGNVTVSGNAGFQLVNSSASLAILLESGSMNLGGNGVLCAPLASPSNNVPFTPLPKRVAILGTNNTNPSNSVTLATNTPFYGVLYFPYLHVTVGSGLTSPTVYGAVVGKWVTMENSPTVHYDIALRYPDALVSDAAFACLLAPLSAGVLAASPGP